VLGWMRQTVLKDFFVVKDTSYYRENLAKTEGVLG
jgi:hypothetical protein